MGANMLYAVATVPHRAGRAVLDDDTRNALFHSGDSVALTRLVDRLVDQGARTRLSEYLRDFGLLENAEAHDDLFEGTEVLPDGETDEESDDRLERLLDPSWTISHGDATLLLVRCLRQVVGDDAEVSTIQLPGSAVHWITGGPSWGDDPTSAFTPLNILCEAALFDQPVGDEDLAHALAR